MRYPGPPGSSRARAAICVALVAAALAGCTAPESDVDTAVRDARLVSETPFRNEQRVIIPGRVGGSRELALILDTGAPKRDLGIFYPELGEEMGLEYVEEGTMGGGGSGPGARVMFAEGVPLSVAGVELEPERVVVPSERRPNFPEQDGIIGRVLFDEYVVELDFESSVMRLYDRRRFQPGDGWSELRLDFVEGVPVVDASVLMGQRRVPVRLFVDLGARLALALVPDASRGLVPPDDAERYLIGSGTQGEVHGVRTTTPLLMLDDIRVTEVEASFADAGADPNLGPPGVDGMLGIEVLGRFNVIIDYPRERIFLGTRTDADGTGSGPGDPAGSAATQEETR